MIAARFLSLDVRQVLGAIGANPLKIHCNLEPSHESATQESEGIMLLLDARSVQLIVFGVVGATILGAIVFVAATLYDRFHNKDQDGPTHG